MLMFNKYVFPFFSFQVLQDERCMSVKWNIDFKTHIILELSFFEQKWVELLSGYFPSISEEICSIQCKFLKIV